jgi:hypothetical protein
MSARRGTTLAELVVAFSMAALLAALGAVMLASAERQLRQSMAGAGDRRVVREVGEILRAELASVPRDDVRMRGDTAVDVLTEVASAVVCLATGRVVVLPGESRSAAPPFTVFRAPPQSGDLVTWFDSTAGGTWTHTTLDSAAVRSDGAGCSTASGFRSETDSAARRPVWRLVVHTADLPPVAGTPLRIRRPVRYALYYGSDRRWTLGMRNCDAAWSCAPAQPVAGPLAPPADSGLRFAAVDSGFAVSVLVRAPAPDDGRARESRTSRIVLRNGSP